MPVVTSVDISSLRAGCTAESSAAAAITARQIDDACRETGFLSVTGHGIPASLIEAMLGVTTAFFDQPLPQKSALHVADRTANRGYAGSQSEALSYSIGKPPAPDLFEAFNVGSELSAQQRKGLSPSGARLFAPNVWPALVGRETWLAYWNARHELGRVLLAGCALALELPSGFFERFVARCACVMRAINYQREEGAPEPLSGQWRDVIAEPGAFIGNIGDLLADWTNDRWHSTLHRVVPAPSAASGAVRRRSVAWFQQPDPDAVIEILPSVAKLMGPRTGRVSKVDEVFTGPAR